MSASGERLLRRTHSKFHNASSARRIRRGYCEAKQLARDRGIKWVLDLGIPCKISTCKSVPVS
jgi:hypothetical protein